MVACGVPSPFLGAACSCLLLITLLVQLCSHLPQVMPVLACCFIADGLNVVQGAVLRGAGRQWWTAGWSACRFVNLSVTWLYMRAGTLHVLLGQHALCLGPPRLTWLVQLCMHILPLCSTAHHRHRVVLPLTPLMYPSCSERTQPLATPRSQHGRLVGRGRAARVLPRTQV